MTLVVVSLVLLLLVLGLSLPGMLMAIKGWPSVGWPMRLGWLVGLYLQLLALAWSAVSLLLFLL